MKILFMTASMMIFLGVVACTTQKEIVHEQTVVHELAPNGPPGSSVAGQNSGGTDSGGGNGFHGKPLESYKVNINSIAEFSRVKTIVQNVATQIPELGGGLWHIAQERSWYLIPGDLDAIPPERIGVAFKTDQMAMQNLGEVWMAGNLFTIMTADDRSMLLLHELVMGVYLMRFQDDLDHCYAAISQEALIMQTEQEKSQYQKDRKTCNNKYNGFAGTGLGSGSAVLIPPIPMVNVEADDYSNKIRPLVNKIWESNGLVDGAEVRAWMKVKNF